MDKGPNYITKDKNLKLKLIIGLILILAAPIIFIWFMFLPESLLRGFLCISSFVIGLVGVILLSFFISSQLRAGSFNRYRGKRYPYNSYSPIYSQYPQQSGYYPPYPGQQLMSMHGYHKIKTPVYEGLYTQPPEKPRLRFDILPKTLFQPKKAFLELYNHTTAFQGIFVVLLLTSIVVILNLTVSIDFNISIMQSISSYRGIYFLFMIGSNPILALPFALVTVIGSAWLSAHFSRIFLQGRGDVDKTIGLVGYGRTVSLFLGIIYLIALTYIIATLYGSDSSPVVGSMDHMEEFILTYTILVISFIWTIIVSGIAVSVANDIPIAQGIFVYTISLVAIGIIIIIMIGIAIFGIMAFGSISIIPV
jgi:hypothetical protein